MACISARTSVRTRSRISDRGGAGPSAGSAEESSPDLVDGRLLLTTTESVSGGSRRAAAKEWDARVDARVEGRVDGRALEETGAFLEVR